MFRIATTRAVTHGFGGFNGLWTTTDKILKTVSVASPVVCQRWIREWRQAYIYPPNYLEDHHLFFPSLQEHLANKKAMDDPLEFVDIGEQMDPITMSRKEKKKVETRKSKLKISSETDLIQLANTEVASKFYDFEELQQRWLCSKEGKMEFLSLGHHYGIFSDLFSSATHVALVDKTPKVEQQDYYPRLEEPLLDVLGDWYPGASYKVKREPKKVFYFNPVVNLKIEFAVPESMTIEKEEIVKPESESEQKDSGMFEVSPVFRGNHIKPKYAQLKPLVHISVPNRNSGQADASSVPDSIINLAGDAENYYTLALLNLDSQFGDSYPQCHWLVNNIKYNQKSKSTEFTESIKYMPVYGFKGFGYHRYVFLVLRHKNQVEFNKVENYELKNRIFNVMEEIKTRGLTPVGLSWFQTTWDESCQRIFHELLDMKSPYYEWIQPQAALQPQVLYPEKTAFNVYLDHYRDPKEINKEVLVQRLKEVHPFQYHQQILPSKLPPNIYKYNGPSWMRNVEWKKRNRLGPYRHLRPASAIQPLNNNADLDNPIWPHKSKLNYPLRYPSARKRWIPLRETRWSLPPQDHPTIFIGHPENIQSKEDDEK